MHVVCSIRPQFLVSRNTFNIYIFAGTIYFLYIIKKTCQFILLEKNRYNAIVLININLIYVNIVLFLNRWFCISRMLIRHARRLREHIRRDQTLNNQQSIVDSNIRDCLKQLLFARGNNDAASFQIQRQRS